MTIEGQVITLEEIKNMSIQDFKMLCSFLDENQLERLERHVDDEKAVYILNVLSQLK